MFELISKMKITYIFKQIVSDSAAQKFLKNLTFNFSNSVVWKFSNVHIHFIRHGCIEINSQVKKYIPIGYVNV